MIVREKYLDRSMRRTIEDNASCVISNSVFSVGFLDLGLDGLPSFCRLGYISSDRFTDYPLALVTSICMGGPHLPGCNAQ